MLVRFKVFFILGSSDNQLNLMMCEFSSPYNSWNQSKMLEVYSQGKHLTSLGILLKIQLKSSISEDKTCFYGNNRNTIFWGNLGSWKNNVLTKLRKPESRMYLEIVVEHIIHDCIQTTVIFHQRKQKLSLSKITNVSIYEWSNKSTKFLWQSLY